MPATEPAASWLSALSLAAAGLATPALVLSADDAKTYDEDEMLKKASAFFGKGAEGLATVLEKVFKDRLKKR